jgi:hypothetical protein
MFRAVAVALLLSASISAGGMHSIWVGPISGSEIAALERQGFDLEGVRGCKARFYASSEQAELLGHLGYFTTEVPTPMPLVPYPTLSAVYDTLDAIVARHPDICRLQSIGATAQGRQIYAVIVSDNVAMEEVEPEFRLVGAIHGDEKTGAMVALNYLRNLADFSATSSMCSYVVNTAETWVIPVLNPDGYASNSRYNSNGVDLNRNLSYMWEAGGGGGSSPFSELETQHLRDVTMTNWPAQTGFNHPFCASASLHGGEACFNYVWNYSSAAVQDTALIVQMANDYAALCMVPGFWVTEGWAWYIIHGDVNDWSYGEYGGIDHTIEVHLDKQASDWPGVANAHYMALLDFYQKSTYGFWGTVEDQSGNPLDAMIQITVQDGTDSGPMRFCRTDVALGDYAKPALPGIYSVTATVAGYAPQTISNVSLAADSRVEVSFVFGAAGTEEQGGPGSPALAVQASPSPFSSVCNFTLISGVEGGLSIYDICGRTVFEAPVQAGSSVMAWNGTDSQGCDLPSGVYIARLAAGQESAARTIVLRR